MHLPLCSRKKHLRRLDDLSVFFFKVKCKSDYSVIVNILLNHNCNKTIKISYITLNIDFIFYAGSSQCIGTGDYY